MTTEASMPWLKVSDNKRYLLREDGTPFFWLGDTAWELFHKLNREEADLYLNNRADRGFTVVQAVALAELEGVTTPNAYGRLPLRLADGRIDPSRPDADVEPGGYSYWDHVDYIVKKAESLGIYIALLPTWGDKYHVAWGIGPEIFDANNARAYGRWLGDRYREQANIVWVLGGDRPLIQSRHFDIVRAMAEGLAEGDGGRHLRTFHPPGGYSSSYHVHDEPWLDFNMIQSGHAKTVRDNYKLVSSDYALMPLKPTLDGEPCYEDHPRDFNAANGYFDEADVRHAAYYGMLSGALGHTYGHHSIWSMTTEPGSYTIMTWQDALLRPGAAQMKHVRALAESRPMLERVPDHSVLAVNEEGSNYAVAARGENHAFVYTPNGLPLKIVMGKIRGEETHASWFDPRTGEFLAIGTYPNRGEAMFKPPLAGRGNDWVLVLDSLSERSGR